MRPGLRPRQPIADTELAQWLEEQLERRHLSRRAAALAAGLQPIAVQNYIQGMMPDPINCRKLATYFGVSPVFVMKLAGHLTDDDIAGDPVRQPVIAALHGLTPEQIEDVAGFIEQYRHKGTTPQ